MHLSSPRGPLLLIPSQHHNVNVNSMQELGRSFPAYVSKGIDVTKLEVKHENITEKNVAGLEKFIRTCKMFHPDADWVIQKTSTEGKQPPSWL